MKIEHIAMYVRDLEAARIFFIRYFNAISNEGYHNKQTNFRSYFLTFENGARLELMSRPEVLYKGNLKPETGYAHIAFSTGSAEQVDLLTKRIINDGYEVISGPRTTGDGYYESCIVGIEGNLIEITI